MGILVLIMLGISGAWIGSLTLLEPYQPLFAGVASKALILAALRIWCSVAACDSGLFCQRTNVNRLKKIKFVIAVLLMATAVAFPLITQIGLSCVE